MIGGETTEKIRRRVRVLALLGAVGAVSFGALAQETSREATPEEVRRAVAELGDTQASVRERATRFLWSAGNGAEKALHEAKSHPDPEISARAADILADFELGIHPDTPAETAQEARAYRRAKDAEAKEKAVEVLKGMGVKAYGTLARLSASEKDLEVRQELFGDVIDDAGELAGELVAKGDFENAGHVLELAITDEDVQSASAFAAFSLARGDVQRRVAEFEKRAEMGDRQARRVAAYLRRAMGDLKGALAHALKSEEAEVEEGLIEQILMETGDYPALAARIEKELEEEEKPDTHRLGLLAALHRRAGDKRAAEKAILKLREQAADEERLSIVAQLLAFDERPQDALKLYLQNKNYTSAFAVLWVRQEFARAMEVLEKAVEEAGEEKELLSVMMIRPLFELGKTEEGTKRLDELVGRATKESSSDLMIMALSVEVECGLVDRAFQHAVAFAEKADGAVAVEGLQGMIHVLFPGRVEAAGVWWNLLSQQLGDEKKTLKLMRRVMEGSLPANEMKELAADSMKLAKRNPPDTREQQFSVIAQTLVQHGLAEDALEVMKTHAQVTEMAGPCVELGNHYAKEGKWELAAEQYRQAVENDPVHGPSRYLHGQALVKVGKEKEGREEMARGVALPLGDELARGELGKAMREAGLEEEALEQNRIILRTAVPHSVQAIMAMKELASDAGMRGDAVEATKWWDLFSLHGLYSDSGYLDDRAAMYLPTMVHRMKAKSLVEQGEIEEGIREAYRGLDILPGDTEAAIVVAPALRKAGKAKEADALVQRVLVYQEKLLETYPESPLIHNSIAWLLGRTRTDLDRALVHAKKAAEKSPRSTAILDTLAEVHFQRGERELAIEVMGRCLKLEPESQRHRRAMERYRTKGPESEPPAEEMFDWGEG